MKSRPILMSAPMVLATLDGRKTQTRRIIKPQLTGICFGEPYNRKGKNIEQRFPKCPYGQPGDLLWVRETIEKAKDYGGIGYPADGTWYPDSAWEWKRHTIPSIHMPRRLNRLTLDIKNIRVQRLQDISEEDAIAEGLKCITKDGCVTYKYGIPDRDGCPGIDDYGWEWKDWHIDPRQAYRKLWESINGADSWDANPWVWVIEFDPHKQNVDRFIAGRAA